jgi:multiple sugar transport system permease protein
MKFDKKEVLIALAFCAPSLIGCAVFFIIPFIISLFYCFTKGVGDIEFVGFENFLELFQSYAFQLSAKNTFFFMFLSVPLIIVVSIALALLLNCKLKNISYYRTISILPLVIPISAIVLVWQIMFDRYGIINGLLSKFSIPSKDWLNTSYSFYILIALYIWKNSAYNVILFMAGLNNIPNQYYEAAEIDGSSKVITFFRITIPLLVPTIFFVFIISIINCFKVYKEAYLLAGNYPNDSIYLLQHFMNNNFFDLNYQRLSTAAFLVFFVITLLVYFIFKVQNRYST